MKKIFKIVVIIIMGVLMIAASSKNGEAAHLLLKTNSDLSSNQSTPLIDIAAHPNGLYIPNTFLGIHLNRWKDPNSKSFNLTHDYYQVAGATVISVNGIPTLTTPFGHGFYYYRKGITVRLLGMGAGGADFLTTVTSGTLGSPTTPGIAQLSTMPQSQGTTTIQYRPYIPTFGYGAVRSHGSGIQWSTLHLGHGLYNDQLMKDWVNRHKDKKIMFTMTGTPEWLATSNVSAKSHSISQNIATITHKASAIGLIPVGTNIKVRNCSNAILNGEHKVTTSTTTSTSFAISAANEILTIDNGTEILIWGNGGGFGYSNPPKDMTEVNQFITWLMTNFGNNINWIEGQNEANSSYLPNGTIKQNQGQGSWWLGTLTQLAEMQKRIYQSAKKIKPTVLIGSPAITGLHLGQPINAGASNKSSALQMLSSNDGAGGKLVDWIDFVPFHIYDEGATWKLRSTDKWTLYDMLEYLGKTLSEKSINKPNIPIYMNEGGFEHYGNYESPAYKYFNSLPVQQQANEVFKQAAIYAGFGVKGFYPWVSGFLGDYETTPEIAAVYDKINKRIAGNTIHPDSWFNKETGEMFFKTTDGYEEYIP